MLNLKDTPYSLRQGVEQAVADQIKNLEERVEMLRRNGTLTQETLVSYYGKKKFQQVAESNAIEGSTLSAGETELAVLKGMTVTGHDPAYVKDAISLTGALDRLAEMAKDQTSCTNFEQLLELHGLILGDRPGAGMFRQEPVRISGAKHHPPRTREEVLSAMEDWQRWSEGNSSLPALVRGAVLHAWLSHIHPFLDGNGRVARAVTNLELVRAGYPPVIIRKKERDRYIDALAESDLGGDIRSFFELIIMRAGDALTGLELAAKKGQDYSPALAKLRATQERNLRIWQTSISLLAKTLDHCLTETLDGVGGDVYIKEFDAPLDYDDYVHLIGDTSRHWSLSQTWCFIVNISIPGKGKFERLAYASYRQRQLRDYMGENGPTVYWSKKNPDGYPRWTADKDKPPFCAEMATAVGAGDTWFVRLKDESIKSFPTTALAEKIAASLVDLVAEE